MEQMTEKFHQHLLQMDTDEDASEHLEDYDFFPDLDYTPADDQLHRIINLSDDFKLESNYAFHWCILLFEDSYIRIESYCFIP